MYYVVVVFLLVCGKMNFVMLCLMIFGWKVEIFGDDIVWICFGEDGCLWVINFEVGFFGVVLGIGELINVIVVEILWGNMIFINVVFCFDGDVWWEGLIDEVFVNLIDWEGNDWIFELGCFVVYFNFCFMVLVV